MCTSAYNLCILWCAHILLYFILPHSYTRSLGKRNWWHDPIKHCRTEELEWVNFFARGIIFLLYSLMLFLPWRLIGFVRQYVAVYDSNPVGRSARSRNARSRIKSIGGSDTKPVGPVGQTWWVYFSLVCDLVAFEYLLTSHWFPLQDELALYNNQISGTIPSQLRNLFRLRRLYLEGTSLGPELPQGLCSLDLTDFWSDCEEIGGCSCCTACCEDGLNCVWVWLCFLVLDGGWQCDIHT